MKIGRKDAEAVIRLGPGGYRDLLFDYNERLTNGESVRLDQMLKTKLFKLDAEEKSNAETILKSE